MDVTGGEIRALDWAVLCCGAVLLVACLSLFSRDAVRCMSRTLRALASPMICKRGGANSVDREEADRRLFCKMMKEKRVKNVRTILPVACGVQALMICVVLVRTGTHTPRFFSYGQTFGVYSTLVSALASTSLIKIYPRATMHTFCVWNLMAVTLFMLLNDDPQNFLMFQGVIALTRVSISVVYMRTDVVLVLTVAHSALSSAAFSLKDLSSCLVESNAVTRFAQTEAWVCVFVVSMTLAWENMMGGIVQREMDASSAHSEAAASRRLLNTICDATFELDTDLRIVGDAPQLAGTLQHGPNRSLHGTPVEQLIAREDREAFRQRITADVPASQMMANVFHVSLRDSISNVVNVEVFHVPVHGSLVGDVGHLVGIRENSEVDRQVGPRVQRSQIGEEREAQPESGPAVAAQPHAPPATLRDEGPLALVFDTSTFTVLESSGRGRELFRIGTSLRRSLRQGSDFFTDVDMGLLAVTEMLRSDPEARFEFRSVLHQRSGSSSVLESLCRVALSAARPEPSWPEAGRRASVVARLSVERTRSRPRSGGTRSNSCSSRSSLDSASSTARCEGRVSSTQAGTS